MAVYVLCVCEREGVEREFFKRESDQRPLVIYFSGPPSNDTTATAEVSDENGVLVISRGCTNGGPPDPA